MVAVAIGAAFLTESSRRPTREPGPGGVRSAAFVWSAGQAATAGLLGLVFGLTNAPRSGWASLSTLLALGGGIALLVIFVVIQRRVRDPLISSGIWHRPGVAAVMVIAVLTLMATIDADTRYWPLVLAAIVLAVAVVLVHPERPATP